MLIGGLQTAYVNGFAYIQMGQVPDEEVPQRFARAKRSSPGSCGASN